MANRNFPYTAELKEFQAADDAWSIELQKTFGRNACNARYLPIGKGKPGSALELAHQRREAARIAWYISAY